MGKLSAPFSAIITRLAYHTLAGQTPTRILDGWNWDPIPVQEVAGAKSFPFLRMFAPTGIEIFIPRDMGKGNLSVDFAVLTDKTLGIPAHMQAIEKFTDALRMLPETPTRPDISLARTTLMAFTWTLAANYALDISFFARITIALETQVYNLGSSRL